LPVAWFRKATDEEIAAERRKRAWETDQKMLSAMMKTLNSGRPLKDDLLHWWLSRYRKSLLAVDPWHYVLLRFRQDIGVNRGKIKRKRPKINLSRVDDTPKVIGSL
jgi:hypothetical protein